MNRLIEDESLYVNMNAAMVKMNILLDRINKERGLPEARRTANLRTTSMRQSRRWRRW
jgi:hypothetical protein